MYGLDTFSSADWSNAVWKLTEHHWTVNNKEEPTFYLHLPAHPKEHISEQSMTLCLKEIIEISNEVLKRVDLKLEEKIRIALFLVDAGKICERIEKINGFNPFGKNEIEKCKSSSDLVELGKSYLNNENINQKPSAIIEIAYSDNLGEIRVDFGDISYLSAQVSEMLFKAGYNHDPSQIKIETSQLHKIVILETDKGKKFIKINKRGGGLREYLGTLLFKDEAPHAPSVSLIPAEKLIVSQDIELLVQPFILSAYEKGGSLFEVICQMEFQTMPWNVELIKSICSDSLQLSKSTMSVSRQSARNDDLFFDRLKTQAQDGVIGRIEQIYTNKKFKFQEFEVAWEDLKKLHWSIDGIVYQETLEELLLQAREELDPDKSRLIGISHGDWHEGNIIVNGKNHHDEDFRYAYIDLERSGMNDVIEDATLFLTHLTVGADYLGPKYSSKLFGDNAIVSKAFEKSFALKDRKITVIKDGDSIDMQGIGSFGTLESRLRIALLFIDYYYKPVINEAVSRCKIKAEELDHHLKYAILLRLLGGREVTKWIARDQMKMIGLIYKSIGTPVNESNNKPTIERFINALQESTGKKFCEIDLVRHGETDSNKEGRINGHTNIPLNHEGEIQAQELSDKLKHVEYSAFFCSDLDRAYNTTTIVKGIRTIQIIKSEELRERFFDIWEGKASSEIQEWDKQHSEELAKLTKKEYLALKKSPNMESVTEVFQRVKRFIDSQAPWYLDSKIFIGTHGGVLRAILESFENDDLQRKWTIDNCALLRLRYDHEEKALFLISSEGVKSKLKE